LDAGGHEIAKTHPQVEIVQALQKAALCIIGEVGQMVAVDFLHGAAGHLHDLVPYIPFIGGAISLFQGGEDGGVVFFTHLPQIRLPRTPHRAGVRNVKDVFQAGFPTPVFSYDRNTLGTGFHPAAHCAIPQLHAGTGGGIGPLGINQELFIKGIFVNAGGRRQILHPAVGVPRDDLGSLVSQLGYFLQFACHRVSPCP